MNLATDRYSQFAQRRRQLLDLTHELDKLLSTLDLPTRQKDLSAIKSKIESDRFKVMVIGAFKTGKSTLINALLGEEALPAYATPCTAVINEIKWGDDKRAILHFASPMPDTLPDGLPSEVVEHLDKHRDDVSIPPLEADVDRLEEYVVIRDPAAKHGEDSLFDKVELIWPLEICKNGVEIIDSPGLNEHAAREKVAMNYLTQADAVIFTLNCSQLASMSEMNFFDTYVLGVGHESAFFVCNRIDTVRPQSERQRVKEHGLRKLIPLTLLEERGVHFVSALDALEARLGQEVDQELLTNSGLVELEKQLALFLVNERGRIKLIRPAQEMKRLCGELSSTVIPSQIDMLSRDLNTLQANYEDLQPRLKEARLTRDRIMRQIDLSQRQMEKDVTSASEKILREVIDKIPSWAESSKATTTIKVFTLKHRETINALVNEVSQSIEQSIQKRVKLWKSSTLAPLLEKHSKTMNDKIEADIDKFYIGVDAMQSNMSTSKNKSLDEKNLTGKERFLASMTGFLVGDIYSSLHGARFGFSGLWVAVGTQITLLVTMTLLGVVNPFVIIPVLLGGGLFNAFLNADGMTAKMKKKVGEQFVEALKKESGTFSKSISEDVMKQASKFVGRADMALSKEILQIEEQIESVIEAKKKGEKAAENARQKLFKAQIDVQKISSSLFDFAADLATNRDGDAVE